jgi:hypothetical protein
MSSATLAVPIEHKVLYSRPEAAKLASRNFRTSVRSASCRGSNPHLSRGWSHSWARDVL